MGRKHWSAAMCMVAVMAAGVRMGWAAVPTVEDLSGCSLPNGVVTLGAGGQAGAGAAQGELLKLSNGAVVAAPKGDDGAPLSGEALLTRVRGGKIADLRYLSEVNGNGGTFWAFSGRIADLGGRYLAQAASMNATAPMEIPATSRGPAGMHPGLAEGHTYLVQGTDEHYALVRILEKTPERIVVQYVYQPSGTVAFDLPDGEKLAYEAGAGAAATRPSGTAGGSPTGASVAGGGTPAVSAPRPIAVPGSPGGSPGGLPGGVVGWTGEAGPGAGSGGPAAARPSLGPRDVYEREGGRIVLKDNNSGASGGVEPALESLVKQRELLIQNRLAIVQGAARSPQEIERKAQAINDLAALHAEEAAEILVAQVAFLNTRGTAREFTPDALHPAFAALKKLGKPASSAALRGLAGMTNLDGPDEGLDSPWYRAGLLMQVIRAVEGEDVADFLVRRDMEKATDARQRALYEHLVGRK
jgi:hypothetical protein